jgi:hypothetical protein
MLALKFILFWWFEIVFAPKSLSAAGGCRLWVAAGGCVPRSGRARGWMRPPVFSGVGDRLRLATPVDLLHLRGGVASRFERRGWVWTSDVWVRPRAVVHLVLGLRWFWPGVPE